MFGKIKISREDMGRLILRISVGGMLFLHGIYKLMNGIDWMDKLLSDHGLPTFIGYGIYIGEFVAPILVFIGFRTRLTALIITFNMIMAIFLAHSQQIFEISPKGGGWSIELPAFYLLTSLCLFFLGGGNIKLFKSKSKWE